jgi:hypothetical protein
MAMPKFRKFPPVNKGRVTTTTPQIGVTFYTSRHNWLGEVVIHALGEQRHKLTSPVEYKWECNEPPTITFAIAIREKDTWGIAKFEINSTNYKVVEE